MAAAVSSTPKLIVAIFGEGIAGLMTAISIARLSPTGDMKVNTYEVKEAPTEIGAGAGVWRRSC